MQWLFRLLGHADAQSGNLRFGMIFTHCRCPPVAIEAIGLWPLPSDAIGIIDTNQHTSPPQREEVYQEKSIIPMLRFDAAHTKAQSWLYAVTVHAQQIKL